MPFVHQAGSQAGNPLTLTPDERTKITKTHGGGLTLAFIADNHTALTQVLSRADIVKIASNNGGAQALQAVLTCRPALAAAGFSNADIVKIASNNGGAQALQAVLTHYPALAARHSRDAILTTATQRRGAAGALRQMAGA
jgi:chemotaxis response regulator CheB